MDGPTAKTKKSLGDQKEAMITSRFTEDLLTFGPYGYR